ncbi:MAG: PQQ-binding-like beta-propeller repeat protein [Chitinispirillia bacterium]|nr:PQQ-binding-like beta-propeller repeat protein [Chitinispirillia bacterium]MCL2241866.1 PQQ-binding-like beta-propeller repeat protein [Chitinispirillia bacterium]
MAAIIVSMAAVTAAFASDWPNWHGPDRTNKSKETGLLKQWPAGGPKLLWTADGLGAGYSGVSVSGGVVYSAGVKESVSDTVNKPKVNYVFAFDLGGKLLWEVEAGPAWEAQRAFARAYQGSRSTPTVDGGMVFYLSDTGLLLALDAKSGERMWTLNLREKYDATIPEYGYSESPLIAGDRLYAAAYGKKAGVVCLNKKTGSVIWESAPKAASAKRGDPGYASFIMANNSGYKQLISFSADYVYGMDSETGKFLWTAGIKNNRDNNCTDAVYHDGHVFATSGYGRGSILVKLEQNGSEVTAKKVYDLKLLDNQHGGVILHDGHIYGSGHDNPGWFCLDFKTSKQKWKTPGKGSLTFAEGMLYLYDETGTMTLAKASPESYAAVSSFKVPEGGKGSYWAHPVISHGVLYLRHANNLYAYGIKAK